MKPLILKQNSFGLRVFCPKCDKKINFNKVYLCKHPIQQKYKQIVYCPIIGGSRVQTLDTRDFNEALKIAIDFKKEVKDGVRQEASKQSAILDENISLLDAVNYYLQFKEGKNVPHHLKKEISEKHFEDIELNLRYFVKVLRDNKLEPKLMRFSNIDENHVGYWAKFLDDSFEKGSWNKRNSIVSSFVSYIIRKFKLSMYNPFDDLRRVSVAGKTESISEDEFYAVIDAVNSKERSELMTGKQKKIFRYRDYLIHAFKLALYTGLRREEYLTLSWNDIQYSELSGCYIIVTDNLKVERITKKKFKPKVVPVHAKLKELLIELGFESIQECDKVNYIVKPERTAIVETMKICCTDAFRHYYKQAFPDREHKPLGCLRNTYLSLQNREVGDGMMELSSYGSMHTLNKHYIDKKLVAKALNINMF